MKQKNRAVMGLMAAGALALGGQQAEAANIHVSNTVGTATWTKGNVYYLDNIVVVPAGNTLTIEAGTVVRGMPKDYMTVSQGGTLLISRGAKIIAKGTAAEPIVFTDQYDNNIGANKGSVVNGNDYGKLNNQLTGQWGGLILAGRGFVSGVTPTAVLSTPSSNVTAKIEGISGDLYAYGGGNDEDDSGELDYVSIRYGGTIVAPTKEVNGLSLPGVGRATKLNHIEVYNTKDDALEIWGGAAQLKRFLTWNATDDQLDTDMGWRGRIQFALAVQGISTIVGGDALLDCGDKGLEWDGAGDKGPADIHNNPQSCGTMWNYTLIGMGKNCGDKANTAINLRHNAGGRLHNGIVADFSGGATLIEGQPGAGWPYVATSGVYSNVNRSSAAKMSIPYGQDVFFTSGTNSLGELLTGYIGYPYAVAGSMLTEIKDTVFWKMGIPHSIGTTQGCSTAVSVEYFGQDNGDPGKEFIGHGHYGATPNNTGYDITPTMDTLTAAGNISLSDSLSPIRKLERESTVYNVKPTFRPVAYPYTCVAKIDPRLSDLALGLGSDMNWSGVVGHNAKPPADGFFSQVDFPGAMARKNWAGPWSTVWRLGGFETNGVPTGDENGVVTMGLTKDTVNFYITVDSDIFIGKSSDYFCVANKGADWKYLTLAGTWVNWNVATMSPATMTAPLADNPAPGIAIPISTLPSTGTWTIYAGIDRVPNNVLDLADPSTAYASISVTK